ncbi:MAG: NADH-quinone oxidoreductase subunit J [Fibromonadaceae bacterium]|jgi:NADH-quinone oxidoreductase subunit J|nr:NADH-quinone oxidoreductase subunit J [Fibromonadaceae bacterium]
MDSIPFKDVFFYITAVVMVAGALLTVLVKNILHSAIALIGTFFGSAVLYFLLSAEFVAVAQVMVYIGGVVVFIVFAILLTSRLGEKALEVSNSRKILAVFFSVVVTVLAVMLLKEVGEVAQTATADFASLSEIGKRLLSSSDSGFLLPFEAISLLLLISLIGAVTTARTSKEDKSTEVK